jgi:hypothetical protein
MRIFGIIVLCVVLLIGGAVVWYQFAYPTYAYRYRMTVEVMVDGAVHSGSSVIEVKIQTQPNLLSNPTIVPHVVGEATRVDLGDGRNVFALLLGGRDAENVNYSYQIIPRLFHVSYENNDLPKLASLRGSRELTGDNIPTLVTFADLNDLKTARLVGPNEFESVFGHGVHFKRMWIEMTEEAPTQKIQKILPWLPHPTYFNGQVGCAAGDSTHCLHGGHFLRIN